MCWFESSSVGVYSEVSSDLGLDVAVVKVVVVARDAH